MLSLTLNFTHTHTPLSIALFPYSFFIFIISLRLALDYPPTLVLAQVLSHHFFYLFNLFLLFFLFVELSAHPLFFFICCLTSCFFSPSLSFHLPSLPSPSHFQPVKVSELLAGACLMTSILDECDTHSRRDALTNPGGRHTLLKEHLINT